MTKTKFYKFRTLVIALLSPGLLALAALPLSAQSIEFRPALELALKHSGIMLSASADRAGAAARYRAERYAYVPVLTFGSNLGYSYGAPVAIAGQAPSLFNITHDQTLFSFATREAIKAAHSDSIAANIDYTDRTEQVILDTSMLYIELDNTQQRLTAAQQQKQATDQALYIVQQREKEGVARLLDTKRAELDSARVDLRIAELETNIDVLRERLGRVIGRSPSTLETVSSSIPASPGQLEAGDVASIALANSDSVRAADERVRAAHARARLEHKMKYPSINVAGQYVEYASFNNYATYYLHFPSRSYSVGINLRVPVFNLAQNARAAAAEANALHAEADAQNLRDKVAADAVSAQRTVQQLEASAKVARLEYEVAQANIDVVHLQEQNNNANPHEEAMARADVANYQVVLLENQFESIRAQLQLLRQTGELQGWALGNK